MQRTLATLTTLFALCSLPAFAQQDTQFTYQGELQFQGAPAQGEFDLEACVYAVPSGGSALACSAPIENLPIIGGRFTTTFDFGAVFDGSERYLELRVRGGGEGTPHTPLAPRQAMSPAPHAQYAARAPFAGLTGVPPSLADGDQTGITQIVAGSGLSGGTITASGTIAVQAGGITSTMLATGAVGAAQINPTQVQARITGTCPADHYFRGIQTDGSLSCELLPMAFDRVIESAVDFGRHVRMTLRADDRPLLAYHDESQGNVRLYDCADATCSSGTGRTLASSGDVGEGIALGLRSDGRPVLAWINDTTDTAFFHACEDAACSSGVTTAIQTQVNPGLIDLALRSDDRALVAFRSTSTFALELFKCANVQCTSGASTSTILIPTGIAIAIRSDGRPLLAAGGNGGNGDSPRFYDCADAECTTGTPRSTTGVQYHGISNMTMRSNDRAFLLTKPSGGSPGIVSCNDANCTAVQTTILAGCTPNVAGHMTMRPNGSPVAACVFSSSGQYALSMHDCSTSTCTAGSTRPVLGFGRAGQAVAVAVRSDDRPVIAYYDQVNADVGLFICATPQCP
jgi:hypothetical protein